MDSNDDTVQEARRQLTQQVELMAQDRDHLFEVIKINLLTFTAVVAVVQILEVPTSGALLIAGSPLVGSIFVSLVTYGRINPTMGYDVDDSLQLERDDDINVDAIKHTYARSIEENSQSAKRTHWLIWTSLTLTATSLGAVSGLVVFF